VSIAKGLYKTDGVNQVLAYFAHTINRWSRTDTNRMDLHFELGPQYLARILDLHPFRATQRLCENAVPDDLLATIDAILLGQMKTQKLHRLECSFKDLVLHGSISFREGPSRTWL